MTSTASLVDTVIEVVDQLGDNLQDRLTSGQLYPGGMRAAWQELFERGHEVEPELSIVMIGFVE